MTKPSPRSVIRLRGVRQNNLKQIDLDLPVGQLIVITGLSGSGKSSLAFDTLFAEGQRRYIETFSPYARQFFDRMDKPQADQIEGIPPAIAVEQRNAVRTTRSTVGTMTEICDYTRLFWPHLARLYCRQCGQPVHLDAPGQVWNRVAPRPETDNDSPELREALITFELPLSQKLGLPETLALIAKQGYQRFLDRGEILRADEAARRFRQQPPATVTLIQDRLKLVRANRARFVEGCEQAYHFGKGRLAIYPVLASGQAGASSLGASQRFSNRLHCATCNLEYRQPTPALFSFNHPLGACPACHGFGRIITIDYSLALPDRSKTLAAGAVRPWQTGVSAECQDDLLGFCRRRGVPTDVPFEELSAAHQRWVLEGDPEYGQDKAHEWPHAWYGVKGYFRWLQSKAYKMHVRVLLARYRAYQTCPTCRGQRFQPEALLYKISVKDSASASPRLLTLADFYQLPIREALGLIEQLGASHGPSRGDPLGVAIEEVLARLRYLEEVGLGYLTLDRPTRSLSGGETERVNLTTCLGTRLVNTLFVLDEPSVGLHPRDTDRLVRILQHLREAGNTVVVVEHEPSVMRAANQIIDLGPGSGEAGGRVVFQGPFAAILRSPASCTGQYLSGQKKIEFPPRRPVLAGNGPTADLAPRDTRPNPGPRANPSTGRGTPADSASLLTLTHGTLHNLRDLTVAIPLGRFVGVTGVSGSGKTTLIRELLLPALRAKLQSVRGARAAPDDRSLDGGEQPEDDASDNLGDTVPGPVSLRGWETLDQVMLVDQSSLGKTPRSNPAVYIGAFADLRELFARTDLAQQRGWGAGLFSFNSTRGHCPRCRGAGFEKIEMQFLSDVFVRCPDCNGRRYRPEILEVKLGIGRAGDGGGNSPHPGGRRKGRANRAASSSLPAPHSSAKRAWSIADLLEATVDEVVHGLETLADSRHAARARRSLGLLQEVGLGYLRLGQPINTLSGGECQRLKLVRHLAEFAAGEAAVPKTTLFLFDEPTTGLHFEDIRVLLRVFQRLVDAGHSVVVIEHNLEVIKCADWLIDLGPDAGDRGGQIVVQGTPEQVAACPASHTGRALRTVLP